MYCPECGAEFRDGFAKCADCDVPLVEEPPAELQAPRWVTVMETSELSVIPILKTALESAEIPFRTEGEGLMNIFPAETLGAPLHSSAGEVKIRVPEDRAEEARAVLNTSATWEDEVDAESNSENGDG